MADEESPHELTFSDGGVQRIVFTRSLENGPMQTFTITHTPEGAGWTTLLPDGTVTHQRVDRVDAVLSDEGDDEDGPVLGAYLETGELLCGEAAREAYRRRHDEQ